MTITPTTLFRASGVAASLAGLIFVGVQINHPHLDATSITTTDVIARNLLKLLMAALALAGLTGMYLRQVTKIGLLGLLGYVLFAAGFLLILGTEFVAAFVLPTLAHSAPAYVNDVIAAANNGTAIGDIGLMQTVILRHRDRLPGWRLHLRHRTVPRQRPRPLGCGTPGCWHAGNHRNQHHAAVRKAVRHSHRRRPDRPRLLALAPAAHAGRSARS